MRFVNHEGVNEGIEHKEGLNEENKSFEKTIKLHADIPLFIACVHQGSVVIGSRLSYLLVVHALQRSRDL